MPIDQFAQIDAHNLTKAFLVLFLIFYIVFSLVLYRQIQLMNKKLPTTLSAILHFVGIVNVGLALAITFFIIGSF